VRNVEDRLDELTFGMRIDAMTRYGFSTLFAAVERIFSLVNHVTTKAISLKRYSLMERLLAIRASSRIQQNGMDI